MKPFLDCNIWSIQNNGIDNFFLVEKVYHYNSCDTGIIPIVPGYIQVPEFEIKDFHLLKNIDYNLVNTYGIPIVERLEEDHSWKINLKYYEEIINNLQLSSSQ